MSIFSAAWISAFVALLAAFGAAPSVTQTHASGAVRALSDLPTKPIPWPTPTPTEEPYGGGGYGGGPPYDPQPHCPSGWWRSASGVCVYGVY